MIRTSFEVLLLSWLISSPVFGFFGPDVFGGGNMLDSYEPPGVKFIGRGYDIVKGNPDGLKLGQGQVTSVSDPGITIQQWLKFSQDQFRTDESGTYDLPDDILYDKRGNCIDVKTSKMIMGDKSYQEKLKSSVEIDSSFDGGLWSMAFSVGMKKQSSKKTSLQEQKVYFEEYEICTSGQASYRFAQKDGEFELSNDLRTAICRLTEAADIERYYRFIEEYGTHIIVRATLGSKNVTRRETSYKSFTKSMMNQKQGSAGAKASYLGMGGSIGMKLDTSSISDEKNELFESESIKWNMGTRNEPIPLKMKLTSIINAVDVKANFWKFECVKEKSAWKQCCEDMKEQGVTDLMKKALRDYPSKYLKVTPPTALEDYEIVWPEGHWALPRPVDGCPNGVGFKFLSGTIFQDTRDGNSWFRHIHWDKKVQLDDTTIIQRWCAKKRLDASQYELPWPAGTYCIARVDDSCPDGFESGWLKFQDENWNNDNYHTGTGNPDGEHGQGIMTKIEYCCRKDGEASREIFLPTDHSFYLLQYDDTDCQAVKGMQDPVKEWVEWSRSNWFSRWDDKEHRGGEHPYIKIEKDAVRVGYCYYGTKVAGESMGVPVLHFAIADDDL